MTQMNQMPMARHPSREQLIDYLMLKVSQPQAPPRVPQEAMQQEVKEAWTWQEKKLRCCKVTLREFFIVLSEVWLEEQFDMSEVTKSWTTVRDWSDSQ